MLLSHTGEYASKNEFFEFRCELAQQLRLHSVGLCFHLVRPATYPNIIL